MIPGSISGMKWATSEIIDIAKKNGITVFIIGHITKEGFLAGPKSLEHMVDAVLYFQGEFQSDLRILRAEKNRFGPVNELGIFQMTEKGLTSVDDPSHLFIQNRRTAEPGICIVPTMNGLRSILIEIQTLVTDSPFTANPRRISVGFDNYRMAMLISVIEKKLKLPFYKSDVFLNITGGMTIRETAGDLAVSTALISSHKNFSVPEDIVIIGEVGLTGEVRPVSFIDNRIKEAIRQGFKQFILPRSQSNMKYLKTISVTPVNNIHDVFSRISQKP
jgi:DNA repair protein RadA/Sms